MDLDLAGIGDAVDGGHLDKFISVGFVVLVILFQDEIRRFLLALGSHRGWKFLGKLFPSEDADPEKEGKFVAPVVLACMNMARKKTGALIVIQQDMDLAIYEHTGEMFNADVNARLIENIFFKNSPLHDGAMIIADNRIKAAGCILPVAQNATLPEGYGIAPSFWFRDVIGDRCAGNYCLGGERERSPWPIKVS